MVVDQIHIAGVAAFELKDNTPVSGHRNRPKTSKITLERVQPEAGQVHITGRGRLFEAGEDAFNLVRVFRLHLPPVPF